MDKKVICTVGLSNSGKSTWAFNEWKRLNTDYGNLIDGGCWCARVNRDTIHVDLHGKRYNPAYNDEVSRIEVKRTERHFDNGYNIVIIDACHHKRKYRNRWREICAEHGWELQFKIFDTPVEECIQRALAKGDFEIIPVIEKQASEGKIPDPNCAWCGGDELYWQHSPDCDNELCGLVEPRCAGEIAECQCNILAAEFEPLTEEELSCKI